MCYAQNCLPSSVDSADLLTTRTQFLPIGAPPGLLVRAAAANHTKWFAANARAAGGEVCRTNGVTWVASPKHLTIAFPRPSRALASNALDQILAECFRRGVAGASCWSLTPSRPRDLGARVAARGFEWGWRPHWMARELGPVGSDFPLPAGLCIAVDDEGDWDVDNLPYYDRDEATALRALARARPRRTWHFGAWQEGTIVGQSVLFLTTGRLGVAGLYSVGVVPTARNRGIGTAVSLAACQFAQALGCHYVLLNSAADGLYTRLGFQSLGYGQTWWMHAPALAAPPTAAQIVFAEAVGRGDIPALDALDRTALPEDLNASLPNGMTPMDMAVRGGQAAAADWLAAHGAMLDVLHAWDLGGEDRARRRLAECPELANRRTGDWQTTPLHEAVSRGEVTLVRLLLTASPDLEIQDTQFHATPLGWAHHLQRTEIAALLELRTHGAL